MSVIDNLFSLRQEFVIIGLTGRTGSGCTTVAKMLTAKTIEELPSDYPFSVDKTNDERKHRIVCDYLKKHWTPFTSIKASDVIFFYALLEDFVTFKECFKNAGRNPKSNGHKDDNRIDEVIDELKNDFDEISNLAKECDELLNSEIHEIENGSDFKIYQKHLDLILNRVPQFRKKLSEKLKTIDKRIMSVELQKWGTNIRLYDSIKEPKNHNHINDKAPSCLANKINRFIKLIRRINKYDKSKPVLIVIDALRNPFEVLFFRERYSGFYTMSVNTTEQIRQRNLHRVGYNNDDIISLEEGEAAKGDVKDSFSGVDIDRCISLSDIHLTHDGTEARQNKGLAIQLITYIALIKHPGLVTPSPQERLMQVAYTASLNSGCLSRQVGAAVTDANYSLLSIGWNSVACGQVPCTLRSLIDLKNVKDEKAFSEYERNNFKFTERINKMHNDYSSIKDGLANLQGLNLSYCFKDVYTDLEYEKQGGNQVHTRSLHAEENAFLQLAKRGSTGVNGGYLFTTASCCELCGKKAYQLGIKKIYYIDAYPGITQQHILNCGVNTPETILFNGAIGRAYIALYNPLIPQKDEIEALTGVNIKYNKLKAKHKALTESKINHSENITDSKCNDVTDKNGDNNQN